MRGLIVGNQCPRYHGEPATLALAQASPQNTMIAAASTFALVQIDACQMDRA